MVVKDCSGGQGGYKGEGVWGGGTLGGREVGGIWGRDMGFEYV